MTEAEKHSYWLTFHRFQLSREKYFSPPMFKALRTQVGQFIDAYQAGRSVDRALMQVTSTPIIKVLKPLYLDAGIVYGAKTRAYLNSQKARMPIGFNDRMVALMQAYFQTDILNTANNITDTTISLIQDVLSKAAEEGLGVDDIIKQLEGSEISRMRARLITRTETVTAANMGAMFAAKDSGLLLNKEWLAAMDSRTRHDHSRVNGQTVPIDKPFDVGGYDMQQPGDRGGKNGALPVPAKEVVNCRCTTLFIPLRDRQGRLIPAGVSQGTIHPAAVVKPVAPKKPYEPHQFEPAIFKQWGVKLDKRVYDLLDKPLLAQDSKKGSYAEARKSLISIDRGARWEKSEYHQQAVMYHEIGHVVHDQKKLIHFAVSVSDEYAKHFQSLKKLVGKQGSEIDDKINKVLATISVGNEEQISALLTKYNAKSIADLKNMASSTADSLMALTNSRYGYGHKKVYMKLTGAKEAEMFAHSMENMFNGNLLFKEVMPEVYKESITFINSLLP
jgi:hypothetical protein